MTEAENYKKRNLDLSWLLAMYLLIVVLIVCIVFMVKYKNEITTNPLSYGMKLFDFESCSCFDARGGVWIELNGSGFIHEEAPTGLGGT
jgi:hypothetical protein